MNSITMMNPALLRKYSGPVPRYTSYPTAPHFHAGIGAADYDRWLGELVDGDGPVSLYLHVPYCHQLCTYCGCHTKIVARYNPVARYLEFLVKEIDLVADRLSGRLPVSHIHWGGGTPNILSPEDFARVMERLHGRFALDDGTEVAVEVDPRTLSAEQVAVMAETGVTRVSLGVQDFNADVQRAINRVQPLETVAHVVDMLRARGIIAINMDLMYGLPLQTVDKVLATVEAAVSLKPDRVALFGYAHVPWMKTHQKLLDAYPMPDDWERFRQAEAAAERLVELGYRRIGLDHFARPDDDLARAQEAGALHRNFQGYTTDTAETLLAFGASAIGWLPQGYVQNAVSIREYMRRIESGELATDKGLELSADDRRRRAIIERLMCDMHVDLTDFAAPRDAESDAGTADAAFAPELERLATLAEDGLVSVSGTRVEIPEDARSLMRVVCAAFDDRLNQGAGRHSRAV